MILKFRGESDGIIAMTDANKRQIEAKKIVREYAQKLKEKKFSFSAVFLFGSFSQGKAGKWSDIDVAAVSDKLRRNRLKNEELLWKYVTEVDSRVKPIGFTKKDFADLGNIMVAEVRKYGIKVAGT